MSKDEKPKERPEHNIPKEDKYNKQDPNIKNSDWSRIDEGYKPIRDVANPEPPKDNSSDSDKK